MTELEKIAYAKSFIYYTEDAQRFIIDNIDAVIATEVKKGKTSYPWSMNDEEPDD